MVEESRFKYPGQIQGIQLLLNPLIFRENVLQAFRFTAAGTEPFQFLF